MTIGINYIGQSGELQGCINDSNNFRQFAETELDSQVVQTVQMIDTLSMSDPLYPTKEHIEGELVRLVEQAWNGDFSHVLFHYSGHGGHQADVSGDEHDGRDETLAPVDYSSQGTILDDWLHENLINALPSGVHLFGLIDACHSGTMLDLRYKINKKGRRYELINPQSSELSNAMMISGCRDVQYSYDVWDKEHGAVGAMTTEWLRQMKSTQKRKRKRKRKQKQKTTVLQVVKRMGRALKKQGYPQTPQLSASQRLHRRQRIYGLEGVGN
jgi:hypothetical protein